jgi:hypothetical protein
MNLDVRNDERPKLQRCGSSSMLEEEDKSADCAHGNGLSSVPHDEPHSERIK